MLQLTLAYIQQADREREIAADLQNRQTLRSTAATAPPIEPTAAPARSARRTLDRARAANR